MAQEAVKVQVQPFTLVKNITSTLERRIGFSLWRMKTISSESHSTIMQTKLS